MHAEAPVVWVVSVAAVVVVTAEVWDVLGVVAVGCDAVVVVSDAEGLEVL